MNYDKSQAYFDDLALRLKRLSKRSQIAFALASCERMYPYFLRAALPQGIGDEYRTKLDLLWIFVKGGDISQVELEGLSDFRFVEDWNVLDCDGGSSALDAISALYGIIQFCESGEPKELERAYTSIFSTAEGIAATEYIDSRLDVSPGGTVSNFDAFDTLPFQRECRKHVEIMTYIENHPLMDEQDVINLRRIAGDD